MFRRGRHRRDGRRSVEGDAKASSRHSQRGAGEADHTVASSPDRGGSAWIGPVSCRSRVNCPSAKYYKAADPKRKPTQERYRTHLERLFSFTGFPSDPARAAAASVYSLESRRVRAELAAITPRFEWAAYFRDLLTWTVIRSSARELSRAFRQEMFEFVDQHIGGAPPDRHARFFTIRQDIAVKKSSSNARAKPG